MNKIKYQVLLNGHYLNSFESYSKAFELKEQLERKFKNAKIEIVSIN